MRFGAEMRTLMDEQNFNSQDSSQQSGQFSQKDPFSQNSANGQFSQGNSGSQTQQDRTYYQNNDGPTAYYNTYTNPEPPKTNALAIVGMILGIISIIAGGCGWYGLVLGIPGLICSILSRKQGKSGIGVAGIVCSVIGIVIAILMTIFAFIVLSMVGSADPNAIMEYFEYTL